MGVGGGDSIFLKESMEFDEQVVHIDGTNFVIIQFEAN